MKQQESYVIVRGKGLLNSKWLHWVVPPIAVLFLFFYLPCLRIQPAGDDWLLLTPVHELLREHGILHALGGVFGTTVGDFYRPLALVPHVLIPSIWWVQLTKLAFMFVLLVVIYQSARRLGLSRAVSLLMGALTIFHQVFVSVITEVDLWGDLLSAIAFMLLVFLSLRYGQGELSRSGFLFSSSVTTALCLLSKEAGVACFVVPAAFAIFNPLVSNGRTRNGYWFAAACAMLLTLLYVEHRLHLHVAFSGPSSGYYSLSVGTNILLNVVLGMVSLLSPVNTVNVALGSVVWRGCAVLWAIVLGLGIVWGFTAHFRKNSWRMPLVFALLFFAAQGPVFLMPHLTEANMTRSLGIGWILVAVCLQPVLAAFRTTKANYLLIALLIGWFAFDLPAVRVKSADIVAGQLRAARFRRELQEQMPRPPSRVLLFAVADPHYKGYSVYRQPLLEDILCGEIPFALQDIYKNSQLKADYAVVQNDLAATAMNADFLVFDDGRVVSVRRTTAP